MYSVIVSLANGGRSSMDNIFLSTPNVQLLLSDREDSPRRVGQ